MNAVQIEQKNYEMPPRGGSASRIFCPWPTSRVYRLATTQRSSAHRILTMGDGKRASAYSLQLANIWMILNVGGRA